MCCAWLLHLPSGLYFGGPVIALGECTTKTSACHYPDESLPTSAGSSVDEQFTQTLLLEVQVHVAKAMSSSLRLLAQVPLEPSEGTLQDMHYAHHVTEMINMYKVKVDAGLSAAADQLLHHIKQVVQDHASAMPTQHLPEGSHMVLTC